MRFEQLEYLAAVTRHGSLRRASEQLHLSQPALSEALTKLERELGVTLLDRRRSGTRISRRGRELQPHMVEVLEAVDRLRVAAGVQATRTRLVRLGTGGAAAAALLAPAVRGLRESHPDATIEVLHPGELDQALREGDLDLGLVDVLDGDEAPADLADAPLLFGRPVVVMPAGHPLARQDVVGVEELRREPFVAMRAGHSLDRCAQRLLGGAVPAPGPAGDSAEVGKAMVAAGLGLAVLPDYSVAGDPLERAGALTYRPVAGDRTRLTLVLRHRPAAPLPEAVRALHALLVAGAGGLRADTAAGTDGGTTREAAASKPA